MFLSTVLFLFLHSLSKVPNQTRKSTSLLETIVRRSTTINPWGAKREAMQVRMRTGNVLIIKTLDRWNLNANHCDMVRPIDSVAVTVPIPKGSVFLKKRFIKIKLWRTCSSLNIPLILHFRPGRPFWRLKKFLGLVVTQPPTHAFFPPFQKFKIRKVLDFLNPILLFRPLVTTTDAIRGIRSPQPTSKNSVFLPNLQQPQITGALFTLTVIPLPQKSLQSHEHFR